MSAGSIIQTDRCEHPSEWAVSLAPRRTEPDKHIGRTKDFPQMLRRRGFNRELMQAIHTVDPGASRMGTRAERKAANR